MKNFKELKVWQLGFEITRSSYELVKSFPREEKYLLVSQITRAAYSIPSNIAEGSSRKSEREYAHFLEIALGSAFELETHILLTQSLGYSDVSTTKSILYKIDQEQKMLIAFIKKLVR
jgi:four helix bundle protein